MIREEIFAGLQVRITGGLDGHGSGSGPLTILLHGFGAPGDDLVQIGQVLDVSQEMRFAFPAAPIRLNGGFGDARAWWMIDVNRMQEQILAGQPWDRSEENPAGLTEARQQVAEVIAELSSLLSPSSLILGGFSQGAMLSCDLALRVPLDLAGLVLMSGTLLAQSEWVPLMPSRALLPVFLSHGTHDPLLAFSASERLRDLMLDARMQVDWVPFQGAHAIPPPVIEKLAGFLKRVSGENQDAR